MFNFCKEMKYNNHSKDLALLANSFLEQAINADLGENKPNYTNRDFFNVLIIFQNALMDKMFDNQNYIEMSLQDREQMAINCGYELRDFILKYTGLNISKIDEFLK